jgi:hypothetical protein
MMMPDVPIAVAALLGERLDRESVCLSWAVSAECLCIGLCGRNTRVQQGTMTKLRLTPAQPQQWGTDARRLAA